MKTEVIRKLESDIRPISITTTISKIMETFQLDKVIKPNFTGKIDPLQFGIKEKSSSVDALVDMTCKWSQILDTPHTAIRTVYYDF